MVIENQFQIVLVGRAKVSRGEKMTLRGTDPESYITENTLVYEREKEDKEVRPQPCPVALRQERTHVYMSSRERGARHAR